MGRSFSRRHLMIPAVEGKPKRYRSRQELPIRVVEPVEDEPLLSNEPVQVTLQEQLSETLTLPPQDTPRTPMTYSERAKLSAIARLRRYGTFFPKAQDLSMKRAIPRNTEVRKEQEARIESMVPPTPQPVKELPPMSLDALLSLGKVDAD